MSRFIGVAAFYDQDSRVLKADVKLYGYVPSLPNEVIVASRSENVTLARENRLTPNDVVAINGIIGLTLADANKQVVQWNAAALVKPKSDLLPASPVVPDPDPPEVPDPENCGPLPFDPVAEFDQALNNL